MANKIGTNQHSIREVNLNLTFIFPILETAKMFETFAIHEGLNFYKIVDKDEVTTFDGSTILSEEKAAKVREDWQLYLQGRAPWYENRAIIHEKAVLFETQHLNQCLCLPIGGRVERKFRM